MKLFPALLLVALLCSSVIKTAENPFADKKIISPNGSPDRHVNVIFTNKTGDMIDVTVLNVPQGFTQGSVRDHLQECENCKTKIENLTDKAQFGSFLEGCAIISVQKAFEPKNKKESWSLKRS